MNIQVVVNGIVSGAAIALLATAFQVVYLPTRVFFLSLAGVYTLTPYIALWCKQHGVHWSIATLLSIGLAAFLCLVFEIANHRRLARMGASEGGHMIAALGVYIITVQVVAVLWGSDTRALRPGSDASTTVGGVVLTQSQLITLGVAFVVLSAFYLFLMKTNIGLRLRALADNPTQFALFGYSVEKHRALVFSCGGVIVACAALVTAYDQGFDPYTGMSALMLAVVAIIIGGSHTFVGPTVGAILLGILRSSVAWTYAAKWQDLTTFIFLLAFLLFFPAGIVRPSARSEVEA